MKNKQYHAYFSGLVQGVGFRFTVRYLAGRHRIKGWVRNLADGRVELLAEGQARVWDSFLRDLKDEFGSRITDCQLEEVSGSEELPDFQIRF